MLEDQYFFRSRVILMVWILSKYVIFWTSTVYTWLHNPGWGSDKKASDQTITDKIAPWSADPDWFVLISDYTAPEAPCAFKVRLKTTSDQNIVHSNVTLWSD